MDRRTLLRVLAASFLVACAGDSELPPIPDGVVGDADSNFHRIYGDPVLREKFLLFLENIFHLYPHAKLHAVVNAATQSHSSDKEIYAAIRAGLPGITPMGSMVRYALPALNKQKKVMADQAAALLDTDKTFDGYVEIGTVGRYQKSISKRVTMEGPVFVVNDKEPSKDLSDMVERGSMAMNGTFVPLGSYDPIDAGVVPDGTVDLITNYIGFHHCPKASLEGFIDGIRRVLRPGGTLILREHDVVDKTMHTFVALAHDVFNAGTEVAWADNAGELRHFRSVADWTSLLESKGFKRTSGAEKQDGDPTDNVLMAFSKV